MAIDEIGISLYKRFEKMDSDRGQWKSHWDEAQEFAYPRRDNIYRSQTPGEKKSNRLYDSIGVLSTKFLASALHGILTNPTSVWMGLSTGDDTLDKQDSVQKWLQESTRIMINTMNASNFQTEIHEVYIDFAVLGTSVLRVEEDDEDDVRFHARPIYEHTVDENSRGVVDTVFYEFEMTVRQLVEKFGEDVLDEDMRKKLQEDPMWKEKVLHAVQPASDFIKFLNPIGNKQFVSYKVLKRSKAVLEKKGFFENPYIVPRWTKLSGETYGRSPAMESLSDLKMTNKMKKALIEQAQLAVAPPLQAPDDGVLLPIKTGPRSVNFFRSGTKDRIEKMDLAGNINLGDNFTEQVHAIIRSHFFLDQLQIREADRMTATEVIQRRDEQLRTLGPILGRQHNELLKPLVERVFNILDRRGKIPPAPPELVDRRVEVQYTSQIAKAQMSAEGDQVIKAMQLIQPFLQMDPTLIDNIDGDEVIRFSSKIYGLPHEILRDKRDVDSRRAERNAAAQQEAQLDQQTAEADIAQKTAGIEQV